MQRQLLYLTLPGQGVLRASRVVTGTLHIVLSLRFLHFVSSKSKDNLAASTHKKLNRTSNAKWADATSDQVNLIKQFGIHDFSLENFWEEIVRETQAKHNVRAWLESQGTL